MKTIKGNLKLTSHKIGDGRRWYASVETDDLNSPLFGQPVVIVSAEDFARMESLAERHDKLIEHSMGAMQIAEGDEGWDEIPVDCPMMGAVRKLKFDAEQAEAALARVRKLEADWSEMASKVPKEKLRGDKLKVHEMLEELRSELKAALGDKEGE